MIVTQWFSCKTKPVHEGWYDCYFSNSGFTENRYWDGFCWKITDMFERESLFGYVKGDKWRGLAVKP